MRAYAEQGAKTAGEVVREALWFLAFSALALAVVGGIVAAGVLLRVGAAVIEPKLFATVAAFLLPMVLGFAVGRLTRNGVARHVWVAGLLLFAVVCVHVLDLPTGPGLCDGCGPGQKLWRTFFDLAHGSGLMQGDGLLAGVWMPLALFGFSLGARLALSNED